MVDDEGLDTVFAEIMSFARKCRFSDCTHHSEPGCAVREAISAGELDLVRLNHYQKLEAEAQSYEIRHDKRRQRESERTFSKMVRQTMALKIKKR
jgi:ribosome biogenesis GTPase